MNRFLRVLGLGVALTCGHAGATPVWEFAAIPESRMHLAAATVSSGAAGVTELISYTCIDGKACTWSLTIALACKPGENALGFVTSPALTMGGDKGPPGSFLRCGGPNPALPGTYVYLVERSDIFGQLALRNQAVTIRAGFPDGERKRDVRIDFSGSAAAIARVNSSHRGR